ncbi:hypothetical protein L53_02405 [Hyphomonas sp. L-53-1-40]|uniref:hypothetical protein n=1 Tax=Hyphomonas sp. L-53-1-40 TaxID=1207058 RepID=UPI000458E2EB|nr:hypothetical protein [Hyphomonas sp. L-53-1-40]KCZ66192.1 hypothetical protein L53_02405 [Hyphomonas sp. L-53-1-40]
MKRTLTAIAAVAVLAGTAAAQDSESLVINLSGEVESNCELIPEGSASYNVDMLDSGDQGFLAIAYSCNSPYTVTLQSANGGMEHQESSGAVNIDYDVDTRFWIFPTGSYNSQADLSGAGATIVTDNDWQNILTNGGSRNGNLDLSFDSVAEYAVAGTYEDTLTITLAANY